MPHRPEPRVDPPGMETDDPGPIPDLDALRREVQGWFAADALARILAPGGSETEAIAGAWLGRSGDRRRPFLAVCAFRALRGKSGSAPPDDLHKIAVAVECFHKASLIHDDIENADALLCGEETLHKQYGMPIALNVGDFLLGKGYRLLCEARVPAGRGSEMLRVAATGHLNLCIGQGAELRSMRSPRPLPSAQVLDIAGRRASPAFYAALRLGAIYADAREDNRDALHGYSECLGIAYQIRDDLGSYDGNGEADDARAMRPSVLLAIAYELADAPGRQLIEAAWRRRRIYRLSFNIIHLRERRPFSQPPSQRLNILS